ncbi:MAG: nuclear transport factor 2 family protein [Deltaproteobacteria bacterium]|nr:nuclear transport factor 2 family protein [Deltaproteobacteria bacterium]MBM4350232.1 nuclear transport factor 2 family protein [Deltaproteobacteria bacterium]
MKTIPLIFVLFLIFTVSPSTEAQIPSPSVTEEEVRQFMDQYRERFMKMDLDAYMALFLKDAVENRALPYADIREAYQRTIARSRSIVYQLKIHAVQTYARSAFVSGRYRIIQVFKKDGREKVYKGNIQYDLVRENSSLKIREINYGRDD